MKVKMLSRNPDEYVRETTKDIQRVPRSYEVSIHPLEVPREYTRALNSVKVQRLLAKPLVASLGGHRDSVSALATHPLSVVSLLSGACDGEVRLWNLAQREWTRHLQAHSGCVRGLVTHRTGETFLSVGDDKTIKQWRMEAPEPGQAEEPLHTIVGKGTFAGVDCHWAQDIFITCGGGGGGVVEVWSELRSTPLRSYSWGSDGVTCVRFNPVETDILVSCASDRNIVLYDLRCPTPLKKVILAMRSNSVAWNPMMPCSFTVANEDHSLYSWDIRELTSASCVHAGHVGAVLDLSYCPTGRRFVSASFDRTLREFNTGQGNSCEVYHAKRMQRVVAVRWSLDSKFLLGASDEMNIRVWKADASDKLGVVSHRERAAMDYGRSLRQRFAAFPMLRRIARHRHLPQTLHSATREAHVMREARRHRERNLRTHSRPDSIPHLPERKKHIVATVD